MIAARSLSRANLQLSRLPSHLFRCPSASLQRSAPCLQRMNFTSTGDDDKTAAKPAGGMLSKILTPANQGYMVVAGGAFGTYLVAELGKQDLC